MSYKMSLEKELNDKLEIQKDFQLLEKNEPRQSILNDKDMKYKKIIIQKEETIEDLKNQLSTLEEKLNLEEERSKSLKQQSELLNSKIKEDEGTVEWLQNNREFNLEKIKDLEKQVSKLKNSNVKNSDSVFNE